MPKVKPPEPQSLPEYVEGFLEVVPRYVQYVEGENSDPEIGRELRRWLLRAFVHRVRLRRRLGPAAGPLGLGVEDVLDTYIAGCLERVLRGEDVTRAFGVTRPKMQVGTDSRVYKRLADRPGAEDDEMLPARARLETQIRHEAIAVLSEELRTEGPSWLRGLLAASPTALKSRLRRLAADTESASGRAYRRRELLRELAPYLIRDRATGADLLANEDVGDLLSSERLSAQEADVVTAAVLSLVWEVPVSERAVRDVTGAFGVARRRPTPSTARKP